jgi:hypothetical protein
MIKVRKRGNEEMRRDCMRGESERANDQSEEVRRSKSFLGQRKRSSLPRE